MKLTSAFLTLTSIIVISTAFPTFETVTSMLTIARFLSTNLHGLLKELAKAASATTFLATHMAQDAATATVVTKKVLHALSPIVILLHQQTVDMQMVLKLSVQTTSWLSNGTGHGLIIPGGMLLLVMINVSRTAMAKRTRSRKKAALVDCEKIEGGPQ